MAAQVAKKKEGYEQIVTFFMDHPEIEYVTTEHFTQDDLAYSVVANRPTKDDRDEDIPPLSRDEAPRQLAAVEANVKVQGEAVEAIKQGLAADNAGEQTWRTFSLLQK